MKMLPSLVLFLTSLCSWAMADDIQLKNGSVLRGVQIRRYELDGIIVEVRNGNIIKYWWKHLAPDEVERLKTIGEKVNQREAAKLEYERMSQFLWIRVQQVMESGVLARAGSVAISQERNNWNQLTDVYSLGSWQDEPVFIHMVSTEGIIDGKEGAFRLYPVGTHRYVTVLGVTKTVAAYATSLDAGIEILAARKE